MRRSRRASALTKSLELAIAAPAVIAMRTAQMMAAGATPSAADRRELALMGNEKMQAFGEAFASMAARQQRAQVEWWLACSRAWWSPSRWNGGMRNPFGTRTQRALADRFALSQADVFARAIAPLHRTATANARRLARLRKR